MQTQPTKTETTISSLDRTDVLPVLDVEAYEEQLVENSRSLSRTDTWTVEALRDIDELVESATHEGPVEIRSINVNKATPAGEAFTVNVDRILKRIADLEAEIVKAHDANAVLHKRIESLQTERDEQAALIEELKAEHARLAEHRTLAEEMAQRAEQQLREETQRLQARLDELQRDHSAALAAAERALSAEKTNSDELARRFAAKLTEHDRLRAIVDQQAHTIDELIEVREVLDKRLGNEEQARAELAEKLAAIEQALTSTREQLLERDNALAEERRHQAELTDEIEMLRASLQAAEASAQEAHREVTLAVKARGEEERRRVEIAAQLDDVAGQRDAAIAERDAAQAQIRALTEERDSLLPAAQELATRTAELERSIANGDKLREQLAAARMDIEASEQLAQERADELVAMREKLQEAAANIRRLESDIQAQEQVVEGLRAQLQTAHDECAIMADQREKARARSKQLTQEILRRDQKIDQLEADLAVHSEALAAIRRDVNRIGERPMAPPADEAEWVLEPIDHGGELIHLTGTMLTVGRTGENDIALHSKMVSRHHARLLIGPTGIIVEDAGSTNGCFVNGEQVRQHLMHDGDLLELGDLRFRLRLRSSRETAVRANIVPLFEQNTE